MPQWSAEQVVDLAQACLLIEKQFPELAPVTAELFGVGGDEGQTTPRLRHAWATYKNLGMGQYWSNFMDIDIFPNTIDYWGPTGMVFYRNQQARYSFPMGEDEFSIAIEGFYF